MTTDEQAKRIAELEAQLDAALSQVAVLRGLLIELAPFVAVFARNPAASPSAQATLMSVEPKMLAALASTQPTADACRASIRREALEEAATLVEALDRYPKALRGYKLNDSRDGFRNIADHIRALATRGTP